MVMLSTTPYSASASCFHTSTVHRYHSAGSLLSLRSCPGMAPDSESLPSDGGFVPLYIRPDPSPGDSLPVRPLCSLQSRPYSESLLICSRYFSEIPWRSAICFTLIYSPVLLTAKSSITRTAYLPLVEILIALIFYLFKFVFSMVVCIYTIPV